MLAEGPRPATYADLIQWPALTTPQGSLTSMERMWLGLFMLLVRPRLIVELGVYQAATTEFLCEFMDGNHVETVVVGFDLPEVVAELRRSNPHVAAREARGQLRLVPGRLPASLKTWLTESDQSIDLALVDATHDYRSVMSELRLLWPRLAAEGYIICDDYLPKYDGVRYAVDRFAATHDAAVLPLLASVTAAQHGYPAELVALRHRAYPYRRRTWWRHRWVTLKADLLEYRLVETVWRRYLRPWRDRTRR